MKAKEIKQFLSKTLGIKDLSVTTGASGHFIGARIKSVNLSIHEPLKYNSEFPLEFRQICLREIYGPDCAFADGGNAGNVRPHDIAMSGPQWKKAIEKIVSWREINKSFNGENNPDNF